MIIEYLVKRAPRERRIMGLSLIAVAAGVCYVSAIAPATESLTGVRIDLQTTRSSLELQERQLVSLRSETAASQKIVAQLKDMPCPWLAGGQGDAILQELQKEAADLGLTVRSVIRERAGNLKLKEAKAPVSLLAVRLEIAGPYAGIMEMVRRLSKRSVAVGLEDLSIRGMDEPPFEVEMSVLVRIPIAEGAKHG